jgi:hypothetical protein
VTTDPTNGGNVVVGAITKVETGERVTVWTQLSEVGNLPRYDAESGTSALRRACKS